MSPDDEWLSLTAVPAPGWGRGGGGGGALTSQAQGTGRVQGRLGGESTGGTLRGGGGDQDGMVVTSGRDKGVISQ